MKTKFKTKILQRLPGGDLYKKTFIQGENLKEVIPKDYCQYFYIPKQRELAKNYFLGRFAGEKITKEADDFYKNLFKDLKEKNCLIQFKAIQLPIPLNISDTKQLFSNSIDIILPYLCDSFEDESFENIFFAEGPYELKEDIQLKSNDVVMDFGSNMGLFSALASARGCSKIYAFEPSSFVRKNYLSKTASLNPNIEICPYAIGNENGKVKITFDETHIGATKVSDNMNDQNLEEVEMISLDKFIEKNKIEKLDFIKADIEGHERYLLMGGQKTLKNLAPKLAICTYHFEV